MSRETYPLQFDPPARSRALEVAFLALVILVMLPLLGALVGFIVWGILGVVGLGGTVAVRAGWATGLLFAGVSGVSLVREHIRTGRSRRYRMWPDRLEQPDAGVVIPFDGLTGLQHLPGSTPEEEVVLLTWEPRGRHRVARRRDLPQIWEALERHAVPVVLERLSAALDRGETLTFAEPTGKALRWGAAGSALLLYGLFAGFVSVQSLLGYTPSAALPNAPIAAVLCCGIGVVLLGRWRMARGGGLLVSPTGIRQVRDRYGRELAWGDVQRVIIARQGWIIEGDALGRRCRLGDHAVNAAVLPRLLRTRLSEVPWE